MSTMSGAHTLPEHVLTHEEPPVFRAFVGEKEPSYYLVINHTNHVEEIILNFREIERISAIESHKGKARDNRFSDINLSRNQTATKIESTGEDVIHHPTHDIEEGNDFNQALIASMITCDHEAFEYPHIYKFGSVPVFTGPSSFINDATFHAEEGYTLSYEIKDGVSFYCVNLTPKAITPAASDF